MTADALHSVAADTVDLDLELDLDVRIVVAGPVAAALLGSTDNGCDTRKDGDC
jgi:FxLD family lantipeptide